MFFGQHPKETEWTGYKRYKKFVRKTLNSEEERAKFCARRGYSRLQTLNSLWSAKYLAYPTLVFVIVVRILTIILR